MLQQASFKSVALATCLLLVVIGLLSACGGGSTTPSSTTSTTSNGATGTSNPGGPGRFRPVTGTVSQYDASTQALTLKRSNGSTQTFNIATARIIQDQKITPQQLSALLSRSGIVVFAIGLKTSNGTSTAQEIIASTTMSGTTSGTSAQGHAPQGTPPAGGNRVFIQHGKLQNNQLVGETLGGQAITVQLSGTTTLLGQTEAAASDLQVGQMVAIIAGPAQGNSTMQARQIVIGPLPGNGTGA